MEPPIKRMKPDDSTSLPGSICAASSEPFEHVHEYLLRECILQHLSGKQIIEISEICPSWNKIITESRKAMSKIALNLCNIGRELETQFDASTTLRDLDLLLSSERKYQNLIWGFARVKLRNKMGLILSRLAPSLVCLTVHCKSPSRFTVPFPRIVPDLTFPKLETLIMKTLSMKVLAAAKNVKRLTINGTYFRSESYDILMEFEKLEHLQMFGNRNRIFVEFSFREAKFKLKSFQWSDFERYPLSEEARANFDSFLQRMTSTLSRVNLFSCYSEDINLIFNQLPVLKSFRSAYFCGEDSTIDVATNTTITELLLPQIFRTYQNTPRASHEILMMTLVGSLTNLEVLTMKFDIKDFIWVTQNVKTLKILNTWKRNAIESHLLTLKLAKSDQFFTWNILQRPIAASKNFQ